VSSPILELLYIESCPHRETAQAIVERIAAEADIELDIRLLEVTSPEDAERLRFLGSPSVRVNGHDVEPGADDLDTFVLACRIYRTESGLTGTPSEEWIRAALRRR